jgi:hypothetical protein
MFKDKNLGYMYLYNKSFIIIITNSISLSVVMKELCSDPLTVRLYKAVTTWQDKKIGRI